MDLFFFALPLVLVAGAYLLPELGPAAQMLSAREVADRAECPSCC